MGRRFRKRLREGLGSFPMNDRRLKGRRSSELRKPSGAQLDSQELHAYVEEILDRERRGEWKVEFERRAIVAQDEPKIGCLDFRLVLVDILVVIASSTKSLYDVFLAQRHAVVEPCSDD